MNETSASGKACVKDFEPGGRIDYRPGWIAAPRADRLLELLLRADGWHQRSIRLFGRVVAQPRLIDFQGDPGVRYRYSGITLSAAGWHPAVAGLRKRLELELGVSCNSVLLNLYRNGQDAMGWHSDDEPELGPEPVIASVSLGGLRRFVLRKRGSGQGGRQTGWEITPGHGSLLVMSGDLQRHWQHQVPRTSRAVEARINLTFRRIPGDGNTGRG